MHDGPKIECACGFTSYFDTVDANIAAFEVHAAACPETIAEAPRPPMSWSLTVAMSVVMLSFASMIWAIAWAVH